MLKYQQKVTIMVVDKKKQYERQNRWNKDNYIRFSLVVSHQKGERIKRRAEKDGISVNKLINNAIDEYIADDTSEQINHGGIKYNK